MLAGGQCRYGSVRFDRDSSPQDRHTVMNSSEIGSSEAVAKASSIAVWHWLVALVAIIALEIACFGPIFKRVGFYLDDWITLNLIKFGPQSFFESYHHYLISDPRVIVRPVEAFYYAAEFCLFGVHPLGYHLVNAGLEVAAALVLYRALAELTDRPALSLVAGLLLIIYPNHDVTHYWATCSSENLSLALSMASLLFTTEAVKRSRPILHIWSIVCFALSMFCYETFLPLVSLNVFFAFLLARRKSADDAAIKQTGMVAVPFIVTVGALLVYSRLIAPHIGKAQVHAIQFDFGNIFSTIAEGVRINFSPYTLQFFGDRAAQGLAHNSATNLAATAVITTLIIGAAIFWLAKSDLNEEQPVYLVPIGLITVVLSYSIFGLNPEYVPTFQTILNRINEGAAVGIAIFIAGCLAVLLKILARFTCNRIVQTAVILLVLMPLLAFSFLANRGYAWPWILSWQTQTAIRDSLAKQSDRFHSGDSIILANCPRYVMWSPLFDGVWDFQPMLQLTLNNPSIKGGVVSERMKIAGNELRDISRGVVCNTYLFDHLFVVIPPDGEIFPIKNAEEFISLIESRGFGFGLDRRIIKKWRLQLVESKVNSH